MEGLKAMINPSNLTPRQSLFQYMVHGGLRQDVGGSTYAPTGLFSIVTIHPEDINSPAALDMIRKAHKDHTVSANYLPEAGHYIVRLDNNVNWEKFSNEEAVRFAFVNLQREFGAWTKSQVSGE